MKINICIFLYYDSGEITYKFKQIVGKPNFSDQFQRLIKRYTTKWDTTSIPYDSLHAWL